MATRRRRSVPLLAWRGRQQHPSSATTGWFEAVAEALGGAHAGVDVGAACTHGGRAAARNGIDLGEVLDDLRGTVVATTGREPSYDLVREVANSWAEETLGWVHRLSCEDPLTGLAAPAHLRTRLGELYREAAREGAPPEHALVVVEVPRATTTSALGNGLAMLEVAERIRLVFAGGETVCRVDDCRLLVLVRRTPELARDTQLAGDLVRRTGRRATRIWIEGLPDTETAAGQLLDELLRTG